MQRPPAYAMDMQTLHGDLPGVELSLERVDMLKDSNVASPGWVARAYMHMHMCMHMYMYM